MLADGRLRAHRTRDPRAGRVQLQRALGRQQHRLARLRVVAQPRVARQADARATVDHAGGPPALAACTQSTRCHRISVLRTSAATHISCNGRDVAWRPRRPTPLRRRGGRAGRGPGSTPALRRRPTGSAAPTRRCAWTSGRARTSRSATTPPPPPAGSRGRASRTNRTRSARPAARAGSSRPRRDRDRPPPRAAATAPARRPRRVAVVVVDAADPGPPERRVLRLRHDERVLDGDARLVVVAVQRPGLQLARGSARRRACAGGTGAGRGSGARPRRAGAPRTPRRARASARVPLTA